MWDVSGLLKAILNLAHSTVKKNAPNSKFLFINVRGPFDDRTPALSHSHKRTIQGFRSTIYHPMLKAGFLDFPLSPTCLPFYPTHPHPSTTVIHRVVKS